MSTVTQGNFAPSEPDSGTAQGEAVQWVGKYRILLELGRGGMSSVYLAVARGSSGVNKLCVLKAVLPELASDPAALSMFLDEARLAAQLNHANVVQTYDVGSEGGRHVIVMEYLEGETLAHIIRRGEETGQPLSTAMCLRIVISALEGLHYAHEVSGYGGAPLLLVHRDISPHNIFVTYGGQVKVLDFGIAKASSSSTQTLTGVVKGKIAYMAPEQMSADAIDRRADVYSVGCVLWTAATGRNLWKDTPDVQILRRVTNGETPSPQSINVACDDELNRIVMKALALDPAQRYATALALQEDLEHYCEGLETRIKQKDIAAFVTALFADARADLKVRIERQLSLALVDEPSSPNMASLPAPGQEPSAWLRTGLAASAGAPLDATRDGAVMTRNVNDEPEAVAARHRRRAWLAAAFALVSVAASAAYVVRGPTAPLKAEAPVRPIASEIGPAAVPPPSATLELRAQPMVAKLFLDGRPLGSNPAFEQLNIDGRTHELRAEAAGYLPARSSFTAARDAVVSVTLAKSPTSDSPSAPQAKRSPAAPSVLVSRPPPLVKAVDCAQTFFIDADGIKKLRSECR